MHLYTYTHIYTYTPIHSYYLLERGADLNAKTDFGVDALGFIHSDKVQSNKIRVFAYKCSKRGRAEASASTYMCIRV